jgi:hypothetical protein
MKYLLLPVGIVAGLIIGLAVGIWGLLKILIPISCQIAILTASLAPVVFLVWTTYGVLKLKWDPILCLWAITALTVEGIVLEVIAARSR